MSPDETGRWLEAIVPFSGKANLPIYGILEYNAP
jgi:hypothetical protein